MLGVDALWGTNGNKVDGCHGRITNATVVAGGDEFIFCRLAPVLSEEGIFGSSEGLNDDRTRDICRDAHNALQ